MSSLRKALLGNAFFSLIAGGAIAAFTDRLAPFLAIPNPVLLLIGLGTAVFGAVILWEVRASEPDDGFALFVIAADLGWVLGALVVLAIPGSMTGKWALAAVSVPVAIFAYLQAKGLVDRMTQSPRRLITEVDIAADPEWVWAQLTDLERFPDWNPFITEAAGAVAVGERLSLRLSPPGGRPVSFAPTITVVQDETRLEWLGHLWTSGVFDGRHRFELEPTPDGTHLVHSEEFAGLLVPMLWRSLDTKTRAGFEAMNRALRARTEGSVRNSA